MKRIIFFDVDNTIFSHINQKIMPQTLKLIKKLANDKNTWLGIATGRGPSKLMVIDEIVQCFKFMILINGSLALEDGIVFYNEPIKQETIIEVIKQYVPKTSVGFVGMSAEVLYNETTHANYALRGYNQNMQPIIDPSYHLKNDVYQMTIFEKDRKRVEEIAKNFPDLRFYHWHRGGSDYVNLNTNKGNAIKQIKMKYPSLEIIAIGDGMNDIEMIKLADVGIAMTNSGSSTLKNGANYIAPDINEDRLYDFFKEIGLI